MNVSVSTTTRGTANGETVRLTRGGLFIHSRAER